MRHTAFGTRILAALLIVLGAATACTTAHNKKSVSQRPNVLWIVWDTVRADRLGVYGYDKPTTPKLDRWARGARVFERCASTAGQTLPSTASWFTGLFPSEHGANRALSRLDDRFTTIAELFRNDGYRTYLFSANAYISHEHNFHRGFEVEEHPWDEQYVAEALEIMQAKLAPDRTGWLKRIRSGPPKKKDIKASGVLAQRGLEKWLRESDGRKPFFAFLNYMEAHRRYIPPREHRERLMTSEQVDASYGQSLDYWDYTFRLSEYSAEELEVNAGTYDAAIAELDDLFANLLASLEASGHLENTIIVLCSDHGELLGEHHMLGHAYSLYEGMIRTALIVHYPQRLAPGRDTRPVSGLDLFPTLLDLAAIDPPEGLESKGVSLLAPRHDRVRLAEYPVFHPAVDSAERRQPARDFGPWRRLLRAVYQNDMKLILADDGHMELYRVSTDPGDSKNLVRSEPATARRMEETLSTFVASLNPWESEGPEPDVSPEQFERLKTLGYLGAN